MFKRAPSPDVDPILIPHRGRLAWQWPDGRIILAVRGGDGPDDEPKTFTQAEVETMITARLEQFRRNNKPEPPADYAQLQAAAAELATLKASGQSDLEKLQTQLDKVTGERDAANTGRDEAVKDAKDLKLRSAVVAAASKAKAVDPDDVFALLDKTKVTIGDDGQVTGADDAVKALLEAKPHLVGSPTRPRPDPGQGQRGDAKDHGAAGRAEAHRRFGTPAGTQPTVTR